MCTVFNHMPLILVLEMYFIFLAQLQTSTHGSYNYFYICHKSSVENMAMYFWKLVVVHNIIIQVSSLGCIINTPKLKGKEEL
jgi:hypothetical protein